MSRTHILLALMSTMNVDYKDAGHRHKWDIIHKYNKRTLLEVKSCCKRSWPPPPAVKESSQRYQWFAAGRSECRRMQRTPDNIGWGQNTKHRLGWLEVHGKINYNYSIPNQSSFCICVCVTYGYVRYVDNSWHTENYLSVCASENVKQQWT